MSNIEDFRNGIFSLQTRRFGNVAEIMIKKIYNMSNSNVLNFDKEKDGITYKNYIGGATFLEMYDAFRLNKKIYLYNDIPSGMLYDEIEGFNPIVINGNLDLVL